MVSALSLQSRRTPGWPAPEDSSGGSQAVVSALSLQPWWAPGWPDPEDSSGESGAVVSALSLHPRRTPGWPDPEDSSGRSQAVVSALSLQPPWTLGWPDPEDSSGGPRALVSALSLQPRPTPGWPDPEARKGAALSPLRAEVTVPSPRMEQSTPAELHGEPVRGQDARCADTGQAASSPRGHKAGGPRTAEETQADRQPHLTAPCRGLADVTKHQHFSAHARAGLHGGAVVIRDRREMRRMVLTKLSQEQLRPPAMTR